MGLRLSPIVGRGDTMHVKSCTQIAPIAAYEETKSSKQKRQHKITALHMMDRTKLE